MRSLGGNGHGWQRGGDDREAQGRDATDPGVTSGESGVRRGAREDAGSAF